MSKAKLAAARELIEEKEYAAARAVLETVQDDDRARKWLGKLPAANRFRALRGCLVWVVIFLGGIVLGAMMVLSTDSSREASVPVASGPSRTPAPSATITDDPMPMLTATAQEALIPTVTPANQDGSNRPAGYIHRDDYPDNEWAFTIDEGTLECLSGNRVIFKSGGEVYALNGIAQGFAEQNGWKLIDEIWRDHPTGPLPKVNMSQFTQLGLSLCN